MVRPLLQGSDTWSGAEVEASPPGMLVSGGMSVCQSGCLLHMFQFQLCWWSVIFHLQHVLMLPNPHAHVHRHDSMEFIIHTNLPYLTHKSDTPVVSAVARSMPVDADSHVLELGVVLANMSVPTHCPLPEAMHACVCTHI